MFGNCEPGKETTPDLLAAGYRQSVDELRAENTQLRADIAKVIGVDAEEVKRLKLHIEELKKENASLREKKVGIPRLLEAMASSPGAEERKALVDRMKDLEEQVEELKTDLKDSASDTDALILLSHGLHARIEGKPDWVVGSNCQTALNFIDSLKAQIAEIRFMEIGGHKVGDIYDHMKKIANQKAGNPWAPNQDFPGKPV